MQPQTITARKIAIWTATAILVVLGFIFLWLIRNVLFLVFLSILLATGIEPLVNRLRKGPFNRSTGILIVYTFIMALIGLLLFLSIPPLIEEGNRLLASFADRAGTQTTISRIDNSFVRNAASQGYDAIYDLSRNFKFNAETLTIGLTVLEVIFSFVTVFVIAFYWLTERTFVKRFAFSLVPDDQRSNARLLWQNIESKLGAWARGQLFLMLFIGVLAGLGYAIMGLKYALVLAVFAAITELIPLVGPYIGGAPAVLVALTQDPVLALVVLVYIVVIQLIEGNILVPRIMNSAVGVTPLTVIVGILVGSALAGIAGALLAVPIAATIQVIFDTIQSTTESEAETKTVETAPVPVSSTDLPTKPTLPEISKSTSA